MEFEAYFDQLKGKTVAVIGIGVSNRPLIELLLEKGIEVTACDKKSKEALGTIAEELESKGCHLKLGEDYLEGLTQDIIFRTPGMRPDLPQLTAAVTQGSKLTSEMEVFFEVCPCQKIAVTGSDGKTTTTTIISELLKAEGKTVHLGGNIGHPLLCDTPKMTVTDVAVLELSSFQLMTMSQSSDIAVTTNLSPNHLDVHKDYQEYIDAKANIFTHQTAQGVSVFNADNDDTVKQAMFAKGDVRWFSRKKAVENGVYLKDGVIYDAFCGKSKAIMKASDIKLPGIHNVENYMAAFAAMQGLVSYETMERVARTFGGVEHRIELVRERNGVRWYNDSIASSPSRTIAGLNSFNQKVILIAGGKDKGVPFDALGPVVNQHVKAMILCGATADAIEKATTQAENYNPEQISIQTVYDYPSAVAAADALAKEGDVVILSPASTSFDRFANFMERGRVFKELVNAL